MHTSNHMPELTVVIPTFNEEENVHRLILDIGAATHAWKIPVHILFVDDSPPADEHGQSLTVLAILRAATYFAEPFANFSVGVIHRKGADRTAGLAGAVIRGMSLASSQYVAVMDGDGQHPPEVLVRMLKAIQQNADIVIASRYVTGGDPGGLNGPFRRLVSKTSGQLAKTLFPGKLSGISDPMSGCFMIRRDRLQLDAMNPQGFKVLLEILLSHNLKTAEVPMCFGDRLGGESKAKISQGIIYLRRLMQLRLSF